MSNFRISIADLHAGHICELRAIAENPQHRIQPQRHKLYKRLGLLNWKDGPREPRQDGVRLKAPPARSRELTALGKDVIAKAPPSEPVKRNAGMVQPWGCTWVSEVAMGGGRRGGVR